MLSTNLLIAGSGFSGLLAAILAKQSGLSCHVFEKQDQGWIHPSNAHYLNAYTIEILVSIGLSYQKLVDCAICPVLSRRMVVCHQLNHTCAKLDLADDPLYEQRFKRAGRFGAHLNIRGPILYRMLLDLALQLGIVIHWSYSLESVDRKSHHVDLKNSNSTSTLRFKVDYLLICEGASGTTADKLGVGYSKKRKFMDFLSIECSGSIASIVQDKAMMYWIYHESLLACMIVFDLYKTQVLQIPLVSGVSASDFEGTTLRERFASICSASPDQMDHRFSVLGKWRLQSGIREVAQLDDWIFILGDALHQVMPSGGMGLNTAFVDVYNLIWKLSSDLSSRRCHFSRTYEQERLENSHTVLSQSEENYRSFLSLARTMTLQPIFSADDSDTPDTIFSGIAHYWLKGARLFRQRQFLGDHSSISKSLAVIRQNFDGIAMHYQIIYNSFLVFSASQRVLYDLAILPFRVVPGMRLQNFSCRVDGQNVFVHDLLNYRFWTVFVQRTNNLPIDQLLNLLSVQKRLQLLDSHTDTDDYLPLSSSQVLIIRPDSFVFAYVDMSDQDQFQQFTTHLDRFFK